MSVVFEFPKRAWTAEVLCDSRDLPNDNWTPGGLERRNIVNLEQYRARRIEHVAATCQPDPDNSGPKVA